MDLLHINNSLYAFQHIHTAIMANNMFIVKNMCKGDHKMIGVNKKKTSEGKKDAVAKDKLDNISEIGGILAENSRESIHCMTIIGQVEGHYILGEREKATKYEHIIPLLVSIEENDDIDGLLIILNTMGGDVEAGLAIAEMIASMKKPTVSLVLGGGHSIGVPLAVAAKKSFIVPSATMTIHPVRVNGLVIGVQQTYNYFREMQNRIVKFIVSHSNINEAELNELMTRPDEMATDIGTIVEGDEAVRLGLIDEVGGLSDALEALRRMANKNTKTN